MIDEAAFLAGDGLVVVLFGVGFGEFEGDGRPGVGFFVLGRRAEFETIVAVGFGGLDIVLIGVRPMEFHLLAFVGNGVGVFLVAAQREEIAVLVIAAEEGGEQGEDLVGDGGGIATGAGDFVAEFPHLGRGGKHCVIETTGTETGLHFFEFRDQLAGSGLQGLVEDGFHLRFQAVEEAFDFHAAGVEDSIDAEVEFGGGIELEEFGEFFAEIGEGGHGEEILNFEF